MCLVPNYPALCSSRELPCTHMGVEHREAADRQKTDSTGQTDNREEKTGHGPCRLTEVASLAAVSPGSWAPPTTSEASAGCNIKCQQGIRDRAGCIHNTAQEGSVQVGGGHRYWPGWPRNVSYTILGHPAGQAGGEKMLADTGRETSV